MKRLRHPVRAIREPFGTAGLIVAIVALVAALGGTALAAKGALTGKQKKEVEKIAKKYAGKPGAAGATGPAGAAGKDGQAGLNGSDGKAGADGKAGETPTATKFTAAKGGCNEGGVEFKLAAGSTFACNGAAGAEGSPWTAGGTLPPGETLTGAWGFTVYSEETEPGVFAARQSFVPISFALPLSAAPEFVYVLSSEDGTSRGCPGIVGGLPTANAGKLCVYTKQNSGTPAVAPINPATGAFLQTSPIGATLAFVCEASSCQVRGSWAVTAPAAS